MYIGCFDYMANFVNDKSLNVSKTKHRRTHKNMWKYKNKLKNNYKLLDEYWKCDDYKYGFRIREIKDYFGNTIAYKEQKHNTYKQYKKASNKKIRQYNDYIPSGAYYKKMLNVRSE